MWCNFVLSKILNIIKGFRMKKLVTLSLVSALSALVLVGCSSNSSPAAPSSHDAKTKDNTFFSKHITMKKAHKSILKAGKENGWKMTEFKSNTIIAEKFDDGETTAVTINFNNDSFGINPKNSDLEDAIMDEIEKGNTEGH